MSKSCSMVCLTSMNKRQHLWWMLLKLTIIHTNEYIPHFRAPVSLLSIDCYIMIPVIHYINILILPVGWGSFRYIGECVPQMYAFSGDPSLNIVSVPVILYQSSKSQIWWNYKLITLVSQVATLVWMLQINTLNQQIVRC